MVRRTRGGRAVVSSAFALLRWRGARFTVAPPARLLIRQQTVLCGDAIPGRSPFRPPPGLRLGDVLSNKRYSKIEKAFIIDRVVIGNDSCIGTDDQIRISGSVLRARLSGFCHALLENIVLDIVFIQRFFRLFFPALTETSVRGAVALPSTPHQGQGLT